MRGSRPRPSIALIADYSEEGWHSMNLVADSLFAQLPHVQNEYDIELVRPKMRRFFSIIHRFRSNSSFFNADRIINRFLIYNLVIRQIRSKFALFHFMDHSYAHLAHGLNPARVLVTCHDLDTFRCVLSPSLFPAGRVFRQMTHRILSGFQKAARVTCDSQATMDDILHHNLIPQERLCICRMGVSPVFFKATSPSIANNVPQLLHVGSTIPRKGIDFLLQVYSEVRQRFPDLRLIRVGSAFTCEQAQLAEDLQVDETIIKLENISESKLAEVMAGATLLLQPSKAEGFGLPVVEAMAAGTPVLVSDLPVLREVGGDAAEYAPVAELDKWVERICCLLHEACGNPDRWELRRERCREQAGKFSWDKTAERVAGIYREMLETL
jgi:glycosyltransferase involved in cell wall biosynthesis